MNKVGVRALIALFLVSLIGFSAQAKTQFKPRTRNPFDYACHELQAMGYGKVHCSMMPPKYIYTKMVADLGEAMGGGLYGIYYLGERYVFINSEAEKDFQSTIAAHETTHYILYETYGNDIGMCESEYVARLVHHKYEGTKYDDSWRLTYGCLPRH